MSPQSLSLILLMILAALHLPVLARLIGRRAGQESAAAYFAVYLLINMFLTAVDAVWRGGQLQLNPRRAVDIQIYGAFVLSFLLLITILYFVRRDQRAWLG